MNNSLLAIDELNIETGEEIVKLKKRFKDYFDAMDITEEQKERRYKLALSLFDKLMLITAYTLMYQEYSDLNNLAYINSIKSCLNPLFTADFGNDAYINTYLDDWCTNYAEITEKHIDDEWYTSSDRAASIAENMANDTENYRDYKDAVKKGYEHKRWITFNDNRVRKSHRRLHGKVIGITETFVVGNSVMRFPKDILYGADDEEIVNCRCSVKYLR